MGDAGLLILRYLSANRVEVADQRDQHGEACLTAIVFGTCSVDEASATIAGPDAIETEALAIGIPALPTLEHSPRRDGRPLALLRHDGGCR